MLKASNLHCTKLQIFLYTSHKPSLSFRIVKKFNLELQTHRNIESWVLEGHTAQKQYFSLSKADHNRIRTIPNWNTHCRLVSTVEFLYKGIFGIDNEASDVFVGLSGLDHESSDFVGCSFASDGHFHVVSWSDRIPAQFYVVGSWGSLRIGLVLRYHVMAGICRGSGRISKSWSDKTHGEEEEYEFESHPSREKNIYEKQFDMNMK